ncbi:hypothetical protein CR513_57072, partial [Mucuna pruriens]
MNLCNGVQQNSEFRNHLYSLESKYKHRGLASVAPPSTTIVMADGDGSPRIARTLRIKSTGVSLAFTLGKYEDEVLCDVVPMEATQTSLEGHGKEVMTTSKRVVRKVLLSKREPLYLLPTNMCFHLSIQFPNILVGFKQMLENF